MSRFATITEDPSYDDYVEEDFYYDLDEDGHWVEVKCDADGNPIPPTEELSPFGTVNS